MSNPNAAATPEELQRARARHLRELLEPWSLRKLAVRTGLSKGVVDSRLSGETPLTMSDVEVFAPVLRMKPEDLFSELLTVKPDSDTSVGSGGGIAQIVGITRARGWKLPRLDSNQEPIGFEADNDRQPEVANLDDYRKKRKAS